MNMAVIIQTFHLNNDHHAESCYTQSNKTCPDSLIEALLYWGETRMLSDVSKKRAE